MMLMVQALKAKGGGMSWLYDEAPPRGRFVALYDAAQRCLSGATTGICLTPMATTTA